MNVLKLSGWLFSGILVGSACLPMQLARAENPHAAISTITQLQPTLGINHDDPVCTDSDGDGECDTGSSTD